MYPGAYVEAKPDHPAVIMAGSGEVMTYAQLDEEANRLSHVFADAGLRPGDHVAMCLENHPRYLAMLWGAHYAGLIYTAISSRLTTEEMAYIITNSGSKGFITSPHKADQAEELRSQMPDVELRLMVDSTIDGYDSYEDAIARASVEPLPDRVGGYDMLYSSGTTGRPKGVLQTREQVPLHEGGAQVSALLGGLFGVDGDSVYLSPAPMYHAAPLRFNMGVLSLGATTVVMEHFDAEEYLALIDAHDVTISQVVPTMFVRMLKLPDEARSRHDISSLNTVIHAAAPCPVDVKRRMIEWWGPVLHEYYAGTEGNGFVYCNSEQWLAHPGTVGFPVTGIVHICDDDGDEVGVGDEGTVYFEGGGEFEYHGDKEKTADSHRGNGWSTLGDVGKVDEDGFLYLTDRKAHMIISGGVNIYPQETEDILTMHEAVTDVAVIGVPNEDFGEEVKAVVQPVEMPADDEAAAAMARQLIAYCREHLADVKCPRTIDFRPELPRHPTGKLYKRLLRDEYWAGSNRTI